MPLIILFVQERRNCVVPFALYLLSTRINIANNNRKEEEEEEEEGVTNLSEELERTR